MRGRKKCFSSWLVFSFQSEVISDGLDHLRLPNPCLRNVMRVNPMATGPGPTNSQKTGRSVCAERIVPRSTSERVNPNTLMSPRVHRPLIAEVNQTFVAIRFANFLRGL